MGIVPDQITYTSDYFAKLLELGERMLKEGNAYIDDQPKLAMKVGRADGIESPRRNASVEDNLTLWEEMKAGTEKGVTCVMRGKIDMKCENKVLRDPSLYRCNLTPHHRTGAQYKVACTLPSYT